MQQFTQTREHSTSRVPVEKRRWLSIVDGLPDFIDGRKVVGETVKKQQVITLRYRREMAHLRVEPSRSEFGRDVEKLHVYDEDVAGSEFEIILPIGSEIKIYSTTNVPTMAGAKQRFAAQQRAKQHPGLFIPNIIVDAQRLALGQLSMSFMQGWGEVTLRRYPPSSKVRVVRLPDGEIKVISSM